MVRTGGVSHSLAKGYTVRIVDVPLWAVLIRESYGTADVWTGHRLCGDWQWAFDVAVPWTKDEDGYSSWSLGSFLYSISNRVLNVGYKKEKLVQEIPIGVEDGDKAFDDLVPVAEGGWHSYSSS